MRSFLLRGTARVVIARWHHPGVKRFRPSPLVARRTVDGYSCKRCLSSNSAALARQSPPKDGNDQRDEVGVPQSSQLIDLSVAAKIEGEESHIATIQLQPGETLRAESGAMLYMTQDVEMDTKLSGASSAFTRMMTGQNIFLTDFTYHGDTAGTVALGTDFPSKILRLHLPDYASSQLICQRGAFLASNPAVNIEMEFTKSFSAGFFGGQGFILQKLTGDGDVLLKGGGTVVKKDLAPGESLRVTSGSIIAFESSVQYDVQMMPGIKNAMFGGEGLFVTTLTGPGQVWMQGMPADRMIAEIARRVPSGPGIGLGIPIGGMGGGGEGAGDGDGEAAATEEVDAGLPVGEEAVAATDAAVDADRQATVASSGMTSGDTPVDADSPSALFGDAAPEDAPSVASTSDDDSSFASEDTSTFDDFSTSSQQTSSNEPTFDDSNFSTDEFTNESAGEFKDGELFDDTTSDSFGDAPSLDGEDGGASSLLGTLWDLFTGGDD